MESSRSSQTITREPRQGYLDFTKSVIKIRRTVQTRSMAGSWSNEWLHWLSMLYVCTNGYFNLTSLSKDVTEKIKQK